MKHQVSWLSRVLLSVSLVTLAAIGRADGASNGSVTATTGENRVAVFVEGKPWAASIMLDGFKPGLVREPKTILWGEDRQGFLVSIIAEQESQPLTPAQVRDKYAKPGAPGVDDASSEDADIDGMAIRFWHWKTGLGPTVKANAYTAKDTVSFDIHITAPDDAQSREQILGIFKSFQVSVSDEAREMSALMDLVRKDPTSASHLAAIRDFSVKFPHNPWAQFSLGDIYFHAAPKLIKDAIVAYERALEYQKYEPFSNPLPLWTCYERLGVLSGMNGEVKKSKLNLDKAYEIAVELGDTDAQAFSEYNLACWHAETRDAEGALKYLKKAIIHNSLYKADARKDSSFESIRNTPAFQELAGKSAQ